MTERCQNKLTQKLENRSYIIYVIIICVSLTVLYFYRFHFATVVLSYGLGCLACYYALTTSFLTNYVTQFKSQYISLNSIEETENAAKEKGCNTCGGKGCERHDPRLGSEPWSGLQVHKQLDQAIEDFYNAILEQFINSWFSKITLQPFFVDELRSQLRYASAQLLKRALKVNNARFLTGRVIPCALRHVSAYGAAASPPAAAPPPAAPHAAACSRASELRYLRSVAAAIMPLLLKEQEHRNSVFHVLVREIFAGWVLLPLTDILADPYILNTLIILATGDEKMAQLPATPNYKVEFLETFVRQTDSVYVQRSKLLNIDLEVVINDQDYFYSFMQYLKTTNHIHLLQFYKDIKSFQTRILNPDLTATEQKSLQREGRELYRVYIARHSPSRVPLAGGDVTELAAIMDTHVICINQLQTSRALYQAARQTHAVLEKILLPRFLHSDEFYNLLIGSRIPTGYQKQMNKKRQDRLLNAALRLGSRLRGALRTTTIDGHVVDGWDPSDADSDGVDNMDLLKYLDTLAGDEENLSTYKVVLTNVEIEPWGAGCRRVFTVAVHSAGEAGARLWALPRSEHDFHLLRAKLHEFHQALHDLPLPSRRDNSPLENLRYKYEDFLQRLLQKNLLQNSELLHLFLTVDSDFSMVVQSTMNATTTDLANIYQNVAHRLKKEKGQHLESFLRNLLISSDMERYKALKHGTARDVEEAQEMSEDIEVEVIQQKRTKKTRNIRNSIFNNNFDVQPNVYEIKNTKYQDGVVGFTQCFMYLLSKVIRASGVVTAIVGSILCLNRALVDECFDNLLNNTLNRLLSERRLAHLIRLGQGVLFGAKVPRESRRCVRLRARRGLLGAGPGPLGAAPGGVVARVPALLARACGQHLATALEDGFQLIQKPHFNKQLVYNLLDLCVAELFPELCETKLTNDPKR